MKWSRHKKKDRLYRSITAVLPLVLLVSCFLSWCADLSGQKADTVFVWMLFPRKCFNTEMNKGFYKWTFFISSQNRRWETSILEPASSNQTQSKFISSAHFNTDEHQWGPLIFLSLKGTVRTKVIVHPFTSRHWMQCLETFSIKDRNNSSQRKYMNYTLKTQHVSILLVQKTRQSNLSWSNDGTATFLAKISNVASWMGAMCMLRALDHD